LNTEFKESFLRDLRTIKDRALLERIKEVIERVEQAPKVQDLAE
jgi:hypothetical protein